MSVQILVSTMNQENYLILDNMNVMSDAIVVNQCNRNSIEVFNYRENEIKFISLKERGVGLSRNTALMRANSTISLFADEDMSYVDNYVEIVEREFKKRPNADIILFNVHSKNPNRPSFNIIKSHRVRKYNCLKYGAVRIALKTEKIKQANVYFSLLFGGGAKYSSGEDSLFLYECINKGLKIYTSPMTIGYVSQEDSTWFQGFTDKYFLDKGILFASLSRQWSWLLCLQFIIRHRKKFEKEKNWKEALKLMLKGSKDI